MHDAQRGGSKSDIFWLLSSDAGRPIALCVIIAIVPSHPRIPADRLHPRMLNLAIESLADMHLTLLQDRDPTVAWRANTSCTVEPGFHSAR
jgi:hypothetical protein